MIERLMVVIILKHTEISNHYDMSQELTVLKVDYTSIFKSSITEKKP